MAGDDPAQPVVGEAYGRDGLGLIRLHPADPGHLGDGQRGYGGGTHSPYPSLLALHGQVRVRIFVWPVGFGLGEPDDEIVGIRSRTRIVPEQGIPDYSPLAIQQYHAVLLATHAEGRDIVQSARLG